MKNDDSVYIKLQQHLDRQAVGFPATRKRSEIKILKHIFSPQEARVAVCLSYRPEPLETIFARAKHLIGTPEELASLLADIQKNGGLETKEENGQKLYCNAPLVVGMYELQLGRLTPEFVKDFNAYTSDMKFGLAFLSTPLPQMRTIPVKKSISVKHNVSSFDEVSVLMQKAQAPFVVIECICRTKRSLEGQRCKVTKRTETCLAIGHFAQTAIDTGLGREITRAEAVAVLEKNQKQGLVLQPSNSVKAEFICSCCGCCCGMLSIFQKLPKPLDHWAVNFQAVVTKDLCDGCGACEKRCQVGAVSLLAKKQTAVVNLNRCLGCGLCVAACTKKAVLLEKKPVQTIPPQTREELHDIIMAQKKGRWQKLKLTGKLFVDILKTGHTDLLR